jgi:hypothetical protein
MDEVVQAIFRTDAEREECGSVVPGAEVARLPFLLMEETAVGTHCAKIREVQVAESPHLPNGNQAYKSRLASYSAVRARRYGDGDECETWPRVLGM